MPEKTFAVNFETSGFKKAASQMEDVGDEADETGSSVADAGEIAKKGLAAMTTAITGAAAGLGTLISKSQEYARQVDNAAEQSGIAAERIQEIAFAAKQTSGAEFDSVRDGLKELAIRSAEAAEGTGEAADAFDRLGISQEFLQQSTTAEVFRRVRQELQGASAQMRSFAADAIFGGEAGQRLVETLGLSNDQFQRLADQARESGAVLSGEQVQALEKSRQAWSRLTSQVFGFGRQIAARLAPIVTGTVIPALRSMARSVRNTVRTVTTMSDTTKGTIAVVTGLTAAVGSAAAIWATWPAIIAGVSVAFSALTTAATTAYAAITSPVTGVVAAIAAVAGVVGLIYDNWGGLVDFFKVTFDAVIGAADAFGAVLYQTFATAWTEVKSLFLSSIDGLIQIVNEGLRAIGAGGQTIDATFGMSEQRLQAQRQRLSQAVSNFRSAGQQAASTFSAEIGDGWAAVKQSTSQAAGFVQNQIQSVGASLSFGGGSGMFGGGSFGGGGAGGSFPGSGGGEEGGSGGSGPEIMFDRLISLSNRVIKKQQQFRSVGQRAGNVIAKSFNRVGGQIGNVIGGLVTGQKSFKSFATVGKQAIQQLISQLKSLAIKAAVIAPLIGALGLGTGGGGFGLPMGGFIPGLDSGGMILSDGIAKVHKGEAVVNRKMMQAIGQQAQGIAGGTVQGGRPTMQGGSINIPLQVISQGKAKGDALRSQTGRNV